MSQARPGGGSRVVRPYVVVRGRTEPSRNIFDFVTLVRSADPNRHLSQGDLTPEHRAVLDLVRHSAQSVAEISAHLRLQQLPVTLPLSVLRILLADLMEAGHITTSQPITEGAPPDPKLLEDVLAGLKRRL
ncbi:DUF742 domain-containing protein [Streptomyces sp. NBC_00838]|uniref:DUF742 domain-containing protein n=1 Tax=Streptomyces sp. NBC_00838 TaxID=2903680 RepID=UPI00386785D6|nr:DUF742 domain-containing protein [Streptomyces sp. NBC_00838]